MIGRNAKIEKGQPRITPVAATATLIAGFSKRNNADERDMAYIENELGRKLVLAKKQPLVKHSMASVYEARRFPYFRERATTRAASVMTDKRPRKILTV